MATESKLAIKPDQIMRYAWGYAAPFILEAGVRNGLFDALADGPKTLAEVRDRTGASERGVRMILNALVGLGLLTKDGPTRYALTPEADAYLVSSKPGYLGGFLRHTSSHLIPKWLDLTEIVRTGRPAEAVNQEQAGSEFFRQVRRRPVPAQLRGGQRPGRRPGTSTRRPGRLPCSTWRPAPASGASPWRSDRHRCG